MQGAFVAAQIVDAKGESVSLVIVNSGLGNIASVANMVRREGGPALVSSRPEDVLSASKLILPGVGAFDHGIRQLRALGLFEAIRERAVAGAPILGICLGMQLLGSQSEEGELEGLGLVPAHFKRFSFEEGHSLRVPHVGWNQVEVIRDNVLLPMHGEERRFYFTHSYHAVCAEEQDVLATAHYGYSFPAVIGRARVLGVQFHPEKEPPVRNGCDPEFPGRRAMLRNRVIPCLLLTNGGLVKTKRFSDPTYVGDPINAIRIFNEKEVDELLVLDIEASKSGKGPPFDLIEQFAGECFMPLAYGGGIRTVDEAKRLFSVGVEKVAIQSRALENLT
ncbi:MAG: imidazole glycerol phosphate synthase subunit HisH, partial [Pseudomonadota bacterium]